MPTTVAEAHRLIQPIVTARLRMRPLTEADVPDLVFHAGDIEVARWTAKIPHPFTDDDARDFIARVQREAAAGVGATFAIERLDGAGLIGCVGVSASGPSAEIGYWVGQSHWRQGIATEALRAVVSRVFRAGLTDDLIAEVISGNDASGRVLEKAGFARRAEATGSKGRCAGQPVVVYGMSRAGWEAAVAANPTVLVAAVAMIDADDRVLIAQRPEGKSMAGLWEFPGGKVDADETPEAALIRELKEELGIDVTHNCLAPFTFASHAYDDFHLLMPLYICRVWDGIVAPQEGQTLKWVRPNRLSDYEMPPADVPLVAMLRDFL